MPSSISSSDPYFYEDRPIPKNGWTKAFLLAIGLMVVSIIAWEFNTRVIWGYSPESYINSPGLWAIQRRRIDAGEAEVAIVGSSRIFFDLNLDTYEEVTGVRPIQLAMVGTSPISFLEDLANDEDFKGLLIVGVTPGIFFKQGSGIYGNLPQYYKDESPSQRIGQQISMLIEPHLAFYDNQNWPLFTLLERAGLPNRKDIGPPGFPVWDLSTQERDRNTRMFWKVEELDYYRKHATMVWQMGMDQDNKEGPGNFNLDTFLQALSRNIEKIRARGGDVVFIRPPSAGNYRPNENKNQPREKFWDRLLRETNSVGVHFEDHPELQGFRIPEWSHLHSKDAPKYTVALVKILDQKLKAVGKSGILPSEEQP